MRALAVPGDHVTTDDLSPLGAILADSATGRHLGDHGITPADFNSYGTRRGERRVAVRATFANKRIRLVGSNKVWDWEPEHTVLGGRPTARWWLWHWTPTVASAFMPLQLILEKATIRC